MLDADGLTEILESMYDTIVSCSPDGTVRWTNDHIGKFLPGLEVGDDIREHLGRYISEEKLDRLLVDRLQTPLPELGESGSNEGLVELSPRGTGNFVLQIWDLTAVEEMDRRRAAFRVGATHEMRTPLTALLGLTEILYIERVNMDPRHAEMVELLNRNTAYLNSLMEDVYDLTRMEYSGLKLEREVIDLEQILLDVTDAVSEQYEDGDQRLEVSIESPLSRVNADPGRIRQVIFNLANNATRHTPAGTLVEITAVNADGGVVITVSDDGPGLGFENPEDAFTPFRRGERQFGGIDGGAGVGLPIARDLITLHRGQLTVDTAPDEGTAFRIWLPAVEEET